MELNSNEYGKLSVVESLTKTSKGQLHYDRNPLTPFPVDSRQHGVNSGIVNIKRSPVRLRNAGLDQGKSYPSRSGVAVSLNIDGCGGKVKSRESAENVKSPRTIPSEDLESSQIYSPNLSFEVMMSMLELVDNSASESPRLSIPPISEEDTQNNEQIILMKRKMLESRLVPPSECPIEMDRNLQKRQEAARLSRQQQNDQLEIRLRDIQTIKEKEKQKFDEENRRKVIEQQRVEAHSRASVCVNKFNQLWRGVVESINTCRDKESLNVLQGKVLQMKELKSNFDGIIKRMHEMENPVTGAIQGEEITGQLEILSQTILEHIKEVNDKAVQESQKLAPVPVATTQQPAAQPKLPQVEENVKPKDESEKQDPENIDFVHPDRFKFYSDLMNELRTYQAAHSNIVNSKEQQMKQFKFDCQKAVNTPVNAISPVSASHLRDKFDKLRNLLSGNSVEVSGRRFSATQQPGGLEYVADLLARKFVRQGEDVVSSNPESAFAIAAVIVALWKEFPIFGRLFLAHYFEMCPYLVPYYVPQQEGQSNQDYYRALGYQYIDGQIEKQDKFLKRMSGLVGLYAAVIITAPRQQQPHPYGLTNAWNFLAAVLNLPPRAEITATVLFHFLEVVGSSMKLTYGKQFAKMLHLLCTEYFNLIKKVTPEGCGGPLVRLEDLLQKAIKSGGIAAPSGQLAPNFW